MSLYANSIAAILERESTIGSLLLILWDYEYYGINERFNIVLPKENNFFSQIKVLT